MEQRMAQRLQNRPSRNPANDDGNAERDFQQLDKNHDGQLDASEMTPELKDELGKWDTNRDGLMSPVEVNAAIAGAVEDALSPFGLTLNDLPLRPGTLVCVPRFTLVDSRPD